MKIVIVGASTTGLYAAHLLAKSGAEVELYERSGTLDFLPRTLIVTGKLSDVLGFVPSEVILNEVKRVELFSKSRSAKLELAQPDLIIERGKIIHMLARMALEAGAKILLKRRFLSFESGAGGVNFSVKDLETGQYKQGRADVLIGADGVFSSVAKAVSYNGHLQTALLQARVKLPAEVDRQTYQVWFDAERTKYFFWLLPERDGMAAVGIIADTPRQAGASLISFLNEHGMEPLEYQAAKVPMHKYEFGAKLTQIRQNVFLIGDAAAQVKVTTVGGVVTGLRGAQAVAETILNGGSSSDEVVHLKRELDLHLLVRRVLDGFKDEDYDKLIEYMDGKLKGVLSNQTRDDLAQMYLQLVASQPKLIMLGAKGLLRGIV